MVEVIKMQRRITMQKLVGTGAKETVISLITQFQMMVSNYLDTLQYTFSTSSLQKVYSPYDFAALIIIFQHNPNLHMS